VKSVEGFHDAPIMHSLTAYRTLQPPTGLKRKLSAWKEDSQNFVSTILHKGSPRRQLGRVFLSRLRDGASTVSHWRMPRWGGSRDVTG
jgi:hypothetical protein